MAQRITLTKEDTNKATIAFKQFLTKLKTPSFTFKYDLTQTDIPKDQRPTIEFTDIAFLKIKALVAQAPGEVGWLGTVTRNNRHFSIHDVMVYPQTVTSATVTTDDKEYMKWSLKQNINKLRFQAHSHVNMGTSPSGVDNDLYQQYCQQLDNEDFFIFMIFNKKNEFSCILYDKKNNLRYDTKDIDYKFGSQPNYKTWATKQLDTYCHKPVTKTYPKNYTNNKAYTQEEIDAELEEDYFRRYYSDDRFK